MLRSVGKPLFLEFDSWLARKPGLVRLKIAGNRTGAAGSLKLAAGTSNKSFYMLPLPQPATALALDRGKRMLDEAKMARTAEGFIDLVSQFQTEPELTFCGLTTLTVVLNALKMDPERIWKGPWRWYDETMLVDQKTLDTVLEDGLTLEEIDSIVHREKVDVTTLFAADSSLPDFRQSILEATCSKGIFVVVAYSRSALGQYGDGHYSPIAAYHAESDSVLILDVARFKYPPHWVPCEQLWKAMLAHDSSTGKSRGYVILSKPRRSEIWAEIKTP